jgi:hypothetical protein
MRGVSFGGPVQITDLPDVEAVRTPPPVGDGVFVTGLVVEGALWSKAERTLVECSPKELTSVLPVVHISAATPWTARTKASELGPYGGYSAPCYKYRSRTGRHFMFSMTMPSKDQRAEHWTLRGVAVLAIGV